MENFQAAEASGAKEASPMKDPRRQLTPLKLRLYEQMLAKDAQKTRASQSELDNDPNSPPLQLEFDRLEEFIYF